MSDLKQLGSLAKEASRVLATMEQMRRTMH